MQARAEMGGGESRISRQHDRGKLTARERLTALLDPESFAEIGAFVGPSATDCDEGPVGDGVVTGAGLIAGRPVFAFAQDFTVLGGSVGEAHGAKICRILDLAVENGAPVIGLNDSGGARIQEGVAALAAYGEIFYRNTLASGGVPQISVIMGPCAGGAVYSPALTDFTIMVDGSAQMFITGPDVVKAVTREDVTRGELGGAEVHSRVSGVAHFRAPGDEQALVLVRELLSYLPSNNVDDPPRQAASDPPDRQEPALDRMVPEDPSIGYDMHDVLRAIVDNGRILEVQEEYATNLIVGFARLAGGVVGIVAQQPSVLAGVLDVDAADKGARFIRFCDCFNIPLVTLADTPGFLPGVAQEHGGIIRHGAKMIYAYSEATVPKLSVVIRKAYGGAYIVMSSKHLRGDVCLAWPAAEIAVMGPEGAVDVLNRSELAAASEPALLRADLVQAYRAEHAHPYVAASRGYIDGVIQPHETRPALIGALRMVRNKRARRPPKKHGNIPL
jgi:acetyl-CoA carboxylase carboxyltransferase component